MTNHRYTSVAAPLFAILLIVSGCGGGDSAGETVPITGGGSWNFTNDNGGAVSDAAARGSNDTGETNPSGGDAGGTCSAPCKSPLDCLLGPNQTAPCAKAACEAGCCTATLADKSVPCDDGDACTGEDRCDGQGACAGEPVQCDDGLDCTKDSCAAGKCTHEPSSEYICVIDGVCYDAGDASKEQPCQVCEPKTNPLEWSFAPGCCKGDSDCPASGPCDQPICDLATGTCKSALKPGCCIKDGDCDDGDVCTVDTCDVDNKTCSSTPKDCTDGLSCVTGLCINGACQQTVQAGFCVVDGGCVADGAAKQGEPCKVCASALQAKDWTVQTGQTCDDGNQCTKDDVCDASGACKGAPVSGCCSSHQDCAYLNDACNSATCDFQTGNCLKSTTPNCCVSGDCCDVANNITKAKGTQCGAQPVATEYQCNGTAIEQREVYAGCDGLNGAKCSDNVADQFKGTWKVIKTCGGTDVCVQKGSGVQPVCGPKPPTGTCVNACGGPAADGTCSCGPSCVTLGTCCKDYQNTCACTSGGCCDVTKKFLKPSGAQCANKTEYQCSGQIIQKRSQSATCTGTSPTCPAGQWGTWSNVQTCGTGTTCTVAADKSSATCKQTSSGGSCVGKCGGQATGCWCDTQCSSFGDCCADYAKVCGGSNGCGANAASTCKGKCGGQGTGGCWCDAQCVTFGDCCKDKSACCP